MRGWNFLCSRRLAGGASVLWNHRPGQEFEQYMASISHHIVRGEFNFSGRKKFSLEENTENQKAEKEGVAKDWITRGEHIERLDQMIDAHQSVF